MDRMKSQISCPHEMPPEEMVEIVNIQRAKQKRSLSNALLSYKTNQKNKPDALCRGRFVVGSVVFNQGDGVSMSRWNHS